MLHFTVSSLAFFLGFAQIQALAAPTFVPVQDCKETVVPGAKKYFSCPLETRTTGKEVEILWIIDDSGSMDPHQQALAKLSNSFLTDLTQAGASWRMGILTTDIARVPEIGFKRELSTAQKSLPADFAKEIKRIGTSGDAMERAFDSLDKHATAFFKDPAAHHVVILISDAENQASILPRDMIQVLTQATGGQTQVFALLAANDLTPSCANEGWNFRGSRMESMIQALQGKVYDLCDMPNSLKSVSKEIIPSLPAGGIITYDLLGTRTIQIDSKAIAGTIGVTLVGGSFPGPLKEGPKASGGFWEYDASNSMIRFHDFAFVTSPNARFEVSYQVQL
ncbi:MAG: VWA domain-containing protein [Bdellovibrionales bacterium]|nr:VWA domain-containing protein [Bdellovibrionales bacterium]